LARQAKPTPYQSKRVLTPAEMERGIARLDERIAELEAFDFGKIREFSTPELHSLGVAIGNTLEKYFGEGTSMYDRFSPATRLEWETGFATDNYPQLRHFQDGARGNVASAIALLNEARRSLNEDLDDARSAAPPNAAATVEKASALSRRIFVVHGRDAGPKEAVARFLERLGFKAIILHEQANEGMTIIEKVEKHSDVGFAVVLLTPDDEGNLMGDPPRLRARQNVLLELGYFIGKLGRRHVCPLMVGQVEIPSDWHGVVNEAFDGGGAWRQTLARELQAAGHSIDWNAVMGPQA